MTTGRLILLGAVVAVAVAVLVFWHYLIVIAGGFVGWRICRPPGSLTSGSSRART